MSLPAPFAARVAIGIWLAAILFGLPLAMHAEDPLPARKPVVLATVNDHRILAAELEARLSQLPADSRAARRSAMLMAVVQQELVRQYLAERSLGASPREIDQAFQQWQRRLTDSGSSPDDYFTRTGMDTDAMRRRFDWKIGWPRFVASKMTDEVIGKFFDSHRRDFDGTRLRVAHILWKIEHPRRVDGTKSTPDEETADVRTSVGESAMQTAANLRKKILSGTLTFADAAKQYSQAPSSSSGGELGWMERLHPMEPVFSAAAFRLGMEEISPPVVSPFGVHLIRCLEIDTGERTLDECRKDVIQSATQQLFINLSARQKKSATITFTKREIQP